MPGELYRYFVEGECEQAFIKAFVHATKGDYCFKPGKIEVFNFVFEKLSNSKAMSIKRGTKVVIVFDTDVQKTDIFDDNIDMLLHYGADIIFVPSIKTFEDEIVYSCSSIKKIDLLLNTNSLEDFKKQFIKHKDIVSKLLDAGFDITKMWSREPTGQFEKYKNGSSKLREKIN